MLVAPPATSTAPEPRTSLPTAAMYAYVRPTHELDTDRRRGLYLECSRYLRAWIVLTSHAGPPCFLEALTGSVEILSANGVRG
jgi:hypothetical protein